MDNLPTKSEFERAKALLQRAEQEAKQGRYNKADALESDATTLANALGYQGGKNQFSEKETPLLHRQFEKGHQGRIMIEEAKARSTVADSVYKEVSADLRRLSKSLKHDDKAIKAGALADRISQYSQDNPAPKALQAQIIQYREKRQELTVSLLTQAEKNAALGV